MRTIAPGPSRAGSDALRRELDACRLKIVELEQSNAELAQFAYMASHDLQEPVRKIMGFSELIRARCGDDVTSDLAQRLFKASERLSGLVDAILALARVTSSRRPYADVSLDAVVAEAFEDLRGVASAAGAVLRAEPMGCARGDAVQLGQLARNLVSNALKHRDPSRRLTVSAGSAPAAAGFISFYVEDDGPGIAEADRAQLFRPFHRPSAGRRAEGFGLGLALCRKIALSHGGDIELAPKIGAGCRFVITLPMGGQR